MYLLNNLLPWFILPFGGSLVLLIWGLARQRRRLTWAGLGLLLLGSNSIVGSYLIRSAESWAVRRPVSEMATADAIVVLSNGRTVAPGSERVSEWGDGDRFFGGIELFRAAKAPQLVFTGAWLSPDPEVPTEGAVLATEAVALGIPAERIVVTNKVRNTADEATEVAALLHRSKSATPRVLLVTSAFHMPRARQLFEQKGIVVEPFPVDFRVLPARGFTLLWLLPSLDALSQTQTALRELYGRAFYWLVHRVR